MARLSFPLVLAAIAAAVPAQTTTLDDPASPIAVGFDHNGGRLTVTWKADGFRWKNPSVNSGDAISVVTVTQPDPRHLTAAITHATSGASLALAMELVPATGELRVTLSGSGAVVTNGVSYPYAFHPVGQGSAGFAVLPFDGGYVLPATQVSYTAKFNPLANRRMEWFGGVDSGNQRGWLGIAETNADFELRTATGTHEGSTVIGGVPRWIPSNGNPARAPNLLSYDRVLSFQFVPSGGYVALAKRFRSFAAAQGWVKTLAQKNAEDPQRKTDRLIGAPVIYLWGDGRDDAMLDDLYNAGLRKAVVQVSVNHLDQGAAFPNAAHANGSGWMNAARTKGFLPGFYDIYAGLRVGGSTPTYDGTRYLWPTAQAAAWAYYDAAGNPDVSTMGGISLYSISAQKQAEFAIGTRLPAHLVQFGIDAYFFDTTCAGPLREDYDTANGHFATRSIDRDNRLALLAAAYANPTRRLVTGTEQGRSWAVPVLHWGEGKFWLGESGNLAPSDSGAWNDVAYPGIMVDVVDPTLLATNKLGPLLSHGWQVPLWELVFHDCMVDTVHWSRPHNKFLYAWDHADRWALLRGQAPLLDLTRNGTQGSATRTPNTRTDVFQNLWSSRWSTMSSRYVQTFQTACAFHERVGYLEMIDHAWLVADRSVMASEFSNDDGVTGHGIAVHFGVFDGAHGVTGPPWSGVRRGQPLNLSAGSFATYSWGGSVDLGSGLAGSQGIPVHTASGSLVAGANTVLAVTGAPASAPLALVLGFTDPRLPLLGGTLVPATDIVVFGVADAQGRRSESFAWPAGLPGGSSYYTQFLVLDAGASQGVAFSNARRLTTAP
ncbi:MAG: hypothetical protein HZB39_02715 [Planctomycetes bacterium]|nr:hypothetical protein [Planctomycetota bacterium]